MKKQISLVEIVMAGIAVVALIGIVIATNPFWIQGVSIPQMFNRSVEQSSELQVAATTNGTPNFVNEALREQYAPASAVSGTPDFVNTSLWRQYAPASITSATSGTPNFVNEALQKQYAPLNMVNGTPHWVNESLREQYAPSG